MADKLPGFATELPSIHLQDEVFREIELKAHIGLNESHRRTMEAALDRYVSGLSYYQKAPSVVDVQKQLKEVDAAARRLATALTDLGDNPTKMVAFCTLLDTVPSLEQFVRDIHAVRAAARHASDNLPPIKRGQYPDLFVSTLIRELHDIFVAAGGRGKITKSPYDDANPYKGQFFAFVDAALKTLDPKFHRTNSSLGKAISAALR